MGEVFFWSDTHFNHRGILEYCTRPWADVRRMNEGLIDRWNSVVGQRDIIHLLGDFAFSPRPEGMNLDALFASLNGQKHLVVGNHDEKNPAVLRLPWRSVEKIKVVKWEGMTAHVCHYPLESWSGARKGRLMLHGHCHGNLRRVVPHRFDVGVEVEPVPVRFETLWETARKQVYVPQDHHGEM